jgi:hypothetical protein
LVAALLLLYKLCCCAAAAAFTAVVLVAAQIAALPLLPISTLPRCRCCFFSVAAHVTVGAAVTLLPDSAMRLLSTSVCF